LNESRAADGDIVIVTIVAARLVFLEQKGEWKYFFLTAAVCERGDAICAMIEQLNSGGSQFCSKSNHFPFLGGRKK
jgi:hypothetical protein